MIGHSASPWHFSVGDAEDTLAAICVRYLLMDDLEADAQSEAFEVGSLLLYSAQHWADHVRAMTPSSGHEFTSLLHELYNTKTPRFQLRFPIFWQTVMGFRNRPTMNALNLAAFNGHLNMVENKRGSSALQVASDCGHDAIVQILLDKGANVNNRDKWGNNALQVASYFGHNKIVQILLDNGADINAPSRIYGSALQAASASGYYQSVRMLLDKGADVNVKGGLYGSALQAASASGHDKIVQMLLDKGASVGIHGEAYGSALEMASVCGHDKIVKMLLGNRAREASDAAGP